MKHKKEKGSAHLSDLSWVTRGVQGQRAAAKEDGRPTDPLADRRRAPCGLVTYPRLTLRRLSPGRDPLLSRCARAPRVTRKSVSSFCPATPPPSPLFSRFCVEIPLLFFWIKKRTFHIIFSRRTFFFFVYKSPCLVFFFFFVLFLLPTFNASTRTGSDSEGTPQKKRRRDEQRRRAARFGDGDGVDGRRGSEGGEGGEEPNEKSLVVDGNGTCANRSHVMIWVLMMGVRLVVWVDQGAMDG